LRLGDSGRLEALKCQPARKLGRSAKVQLTTVRPAFSNTKVVGRALLLHECVVSPSKEL